MVLIQARLHSLDLRSLWVALSATQRGLVHRFSICLVAVLMVASRLAAETPTRADGEVKLPLGEYLALVDQASAVAKARALRAAHELPARAEVVAQRTTSVIDGGEASVDAELEVLVEGRAEKPVELPFAGYAATVEVLSGGKLAPGAAVTSSAATRAASASAAAAGTAAGSGVLFVAPAPGRYTVRLHGRAPIASEGGVGRLALSAAAAPVAVDELDLAVDTAWSATGSVVVEDRVDGSRRHLRLAGKRGEARAVELRRHVDDPDAERLLARAVVFTLFELRPEGTRRHDVLLYDVERGGLATFSVDLPAGLEPGEVATDEGIAVPVVEGNRLTVHRRRRLASTGYLVLTSTVADAAAQPLQPPRPANPDVEVRARFLAVASSVAGEARPQPAASWTQVDLDDLPPLLREALAVVDLAAAWREAQPAAEERLAVSQLPVAPRLPATVKTRETTTLVTVDGTVLHRDRFVLSVARGAANAFELTLPPGAVLWSARVGEQPVRPLQRAAAGSPATDDSATAGGTRIAIPLGFANGPDTTVEVIAVLARNVPPGRSRLALAAAEVAVPVLDHRWRLLLPENARYRFAGGDVRPVSIVPATSSRVTVAATEMEKVPAARDPWVVLQNTPGSRTDDINVGGNESETAAVHGPGGTAGIFGKVTDDQGAVLPGVTLSVTSGAIPSPVYQVSDGRGLFRVIALPPGRYTLKAELAGFSSVEYPNLELGDGRLTRVEVSLSTAVEDVITVTSEAPLLDERRLSPGTSVSLDDGPAGGYDFDSFSELRKGRRRAASAQSAADYAAGAHDLMQGLVGGVKPLDVAVPETGKALLLAAVLPPSRVTVELEVKAAK